MEEILALQKKLAEAQAAQSSHRLNRRNCVELVTKLIDAGKLDVLYTLNGKEYITPRALEREVENVLMDQGGRIWLAEAVTVLNVDLSHVTAAARRLVEDDSKGIVMLEGEVMTSWYLDDLAEEVNAALQVEGRVTLGGLSRRFGLPSDFINGFITPRMGTIIHGLKRDHILYTEGQLGKTRARVRGRLLAATRAVALPSIAKELSADLEQVELAAKQLVESKRVDGTLRGKSFMPAIFSRSQDTAVCDFFKLNGFLELERARTMGMPNPAPLLEKTFDGVAKLDTCFVSGIQIMQVESLMEEVVATEGWANVTHTLPPALTEADVSRAIQLCGSSSSLLHLEEVFIVAPAWVTAAAARFQPVIAQLVQAAVSRSAASGGGGGSGGSGESKSRDADSFSDDEDDGGRRGKRGGRSKGKGKRKGRRGGDDSDDEEAAAPTRRKKKKKGKRGHRGRDDSDDEDGDFDEPSRSKKSKKSKRKAKKGAAAGSGGGGSGDSGAPSISAGAVAAKLSEWYPDMASEAEELLNVLVPSVLPAVRQALAAAFKEASAGAVHGSAVHSAKLIKSSTEAVEAAASMLHLHAAAVEATHPGSELRALADHSFLAGPARSLCSLVLARQAAVAGLAMPEGPLSAEQRLLLLNGMTGEVAAAVRALFKALKGRTAVFFMNQLPQTAEACAFFAAEPSRKAARQLLFSAKNDLRSELRDAASPPHVLITTLLLLFLHAHDSPLVLARTQAAARALLFAMREQLPPYSLKRLEDYLAAVAAREEWAALAEAGDGGEGDGAAGEEAGKEAEEEEMPEEGVAPSLTRQQSAEMVTEGLEVVRSFGLVRSLSQLPADEDALASLTAADA
eukprot:PLAT7240.1.p1 GENE.PLAT7240.1~~PLAT7240.1.p1  ORF type:complete len:863 (-),score=437.98 PLAT7240.1:44-2596(-)